MAARCLTDKQQLFVAEYLTDFNATHAAIRAGYGEASAGKNAWRNLRKPAIQAAIAEAQAPRLAKLDIDADTVFAELARIAFASVLDYMRIGEDGAPIVDFSQLDRNSAAALSEVVVEDFPNARGAGKREVRKIRFRLHDKLAALRELVKLFGLGASAGGEPAEPTVPAPQHDTRQVARAVLAILETAAMEEESADTGPFEWGA